TLYPSAAPGTETPDKEHAAGMKKKALARAGWEAMSFTHKREWAVAIREAKQAETLKRRVAKAIEALTAKARATPKKAKLGSGKSRAEPPDDRAGRTALAPSVCARWAAQRTFFSPPLGLASTWRRG